MNYSRRIAILLVVLVTFAIHSAVSAQDSDLAAVLEVLEGNVEVNRVNTAQWLPVRVEAIVGVGDRIRTDSTGTARITFFADGIESDVLPNTEIRIEHFSGTEQSFDLNVEVLIGETAQRIARALDASSSYLITTPGMSLAARGTQFAVRVEESGRSAMLVSEGLVEAGKDENTSDVPPDFGIRAPVDQPLSDVVRASSFEELDAALDGCVATVTTPDDVSLNVRLAPNVDAPRVGVISAAEISKFFGATQSSGWYRIAFRGGFGWILSSAAVVETDCAGLRVFPDDQGAEDAALYESLGDPVALEDLTITTPDAAPEATPEAAPGT